LGREEESLEIFFFSFPPRTPFKCPFQATSTIEIAFGYMKKGGRQWSPSCMRSDVFFEIAPLSKMLLENYVSYLYFISIIIALPFE